MKSNLMQNAEYIHTGHRTTKPLRYYEYYDDFINRHHTNITGILEIGTFEGESTKVFAKTFPQAKVLTIDLVKRDLDFSEYSNIEFAQADQTDGKKLEKLILDIFPSGLQLIIDDASHYGYYSKLTFDAVFPLLKSGGFYFVEDWGTGYWDSWPDGSRYQEYPLQTHNANIPKRIPSHDCGMVGFVKSLVDLTHQSAIKNKQDDKQIYSSQVKCIQFGEGVCMLLKT